MSAVAVADAIVAAIEPGRYDLIVANFANPDMVGHTGVWDATVAACEVLDGCIGRVATRARGWTPRPWRQVGLALCWPSPRTTATPT